MFTKHHANKSDMLFPAELIVALSHIWSLLATNVWQELALLTSLIPSLRWSNFFISSVMESHASTHRSKNTNTGKCGSRANSKIKLPLRPFVYAAVSKLCWTKPHTILSHLTTPPFIASRHLEYCPFFPPDRGYAVYPTQWRRWHLFNEIIVVKGWQETFLEEEY